MYVHVGLWCHQIHSSVPVHKIDLFGNFEIAPILYATCTVYHNNRIKHILSKRAGRHMCTPIGFYIYSIEFNCKIVCSLL